jgi:hypothetical protein
VNGAVPVLGVAIKTEVCPLQIVDAPDAVTEGVGFTVTVKVVLPLHP